MRIIAGKLGGREFKSPRGHRTHPMSDKIRGAIFNILGDVTGLTLLDAFAGSGATSFEAISRGGAHATAIDNDKAACTTMHHNIVQLDIQEAVKVNRANITRWSLKNHEKQFDLIVCDPPYDNVQITVIQNLTRHLKKNALLVLSWPSHLPIPQLSGLATLTARQYGNAQVIFYRKML
jgi:16S rRNA (guanine966-N2)-methyltransferase